MGVVFIYIRNSWSPSDIGADLLWTEGPTCPNKSHLESTVESVTDSMDAVRAELSKVSKLLERGALEDRWHQISIL